MKQNMKTSFLVFFFCIGFNTLIAQTGIDSIPSYTSTTLVDMEQFKTDVFILGVEDYFRKTDDAAATLDSLTWPDKLYTTTVGIEIIDSSHIYLCGSFRSAIYKSADYGQSWDTLYDSVNVTSYSLIMLDTSFGILLFSQSEFLMTTDGWQTSSWYDMKQHHSPGMFLRYGEGDRDSTVVLTAFGLMCTTPNRGANWYISGVGNQYCTDIYFKSKDTIFSVNTNGSGNMGYIDYCYDGGKTNWNTYFSKSGYIFRAFDFNESEDICYLTANNSISGYGTLFIVEDDGTTYQQINTNFKKGFGRILLLDDSTALIACASGLLLKWQINKTVGFNELGNELTPAKVFPNPAKAMQSITLEMPVAKEEYVIKVYEISGKLVYENPVIQDKLLLYLPQGQYIIQLKNKQGTTTQKVLVLE